MSGARISRFFPVAFGLIPETRHSPLVTSGEKRRTVCINTTITCGSVTPTTQHFEIVPGRKLVLAPKRYRKHR
jgi:hypothetical protein